MVVVWRAMLVSLTCVSRRQKRIKNKTSKNKNKKTIDVWQAMLVSLITLVFSDVKGE